MAFDEHAYMFLVLGACERHEPRGPRLLSSPLAAALKELASGRPVNSRLTQKHLRELSQATGTYLDSEVACHFSARGVNVVGFTVVYDQIYASIFAANYLRNRYPGFRFLFLFGGYSVTIPKVAEIFARLQVPGLFVIGEGERKLEMIARTLLEMPDEEIADAPARIAARVSGVRNIAPMAPLFEREAGCFSSQFDSLTEVPLPDYREYFETLDKASAAREFKLGFLKQCQLPIEGSRGCFAACDFCGLNSTWAGFRAAPADRVVSQARELAARHPGPGIFFVDNVCDTWAERYAEQLLELGLRYDAFMELRAHHPETFWTKLALAGVNNIQIGVRVPFSRASGENGQRDPGPSEHHCPKIPEGARRQIMLQPDLLASKVDTGGRDGNPARPRATVPSGRAEHDQVRAGCRKPALLRLVAGGPSMP